MSDMSLNIKFFNLLKILSFRENRCKTFVLCVSANQFVNVLLCSELKLCSSILDDVMKGHRWRDVYGCVELHLGTSWWWWQREVFISQTHDTETQFTIHNIIIILQSIICITTSLIEERHILCQIGGNNYQWIMKRRSTSLFGFSEVSIEWTQVWKALHKFSPFTMDWIWPHRDCHGCITLISI